MKKRIKVTRPAGLESNNLRDVRTCLLVYLCTVYNCDVQFGQRVALMGIVLKQ